MVLFLDCYGILPQDKPQKPNYSLPHEMNSQQCQNCVCWFNIPLTYHLYTAFWGCYMLPTTVYGNQKQSLIGGCVNHDTIIPNRWWLTGWWIFSLFPLPIFLGTSLNWYLSFILGTLTSRIYKKQHEYSNKNLPPLNGAWTSFTARSCWETLFHAVFWNRSVGVTWQVLMTLTQQEKGISGKMRIAAFLQSVDPGYFEVWQGRFVVLDVIFVWKKRDPFQHFHDLQ